MPKGKHNHHARGPAHPRTNPIGVGVNADGYIKVKVGKSHPMSDPHGWCYLHRLVAAVAAGRMLGSHEIVHHRDGNKADNRIENLEVTTRAAHNKHHNQERGRGDDGRFQAGRELDGCTWDEMPRTP
jgi:hypothetical protein